MNYIRLINSDESINDLFEGSYILTSGLHVELTPDYVWIWNPNRGDPWSTTTPAQPRFYKDLFTYTPGKMPYSAYFTGMTDLGQDLWHAISRGDKLHPHPHSSTEPWYAESRNSHMLDGGESIFIRFVPLTEGVFSVPTPDPMDMIKAQDVLGLDYARIAAYPFLSHIVNYIFDPDLTQALNMSTPFGSFKHLTLLNPAQYSRRTGIADVPEDYSTVHMMGTKEPGTNVRLEYYDMPIGYFINYIYTGNPIALAMFRLLVDQKIARGFYDVEDTSYGYRYLWNGEHYRGGAMVPGPAKEWDLDVIIAHLLWPQDLFIKNCYDKRGWRNIHRPTVWSGPNGARILGRFLHNLYDFYKASGDTGYALRAGQELTWAIDSVVQSDNYFRESTPGQVSGGEGTLAISGADQWLRNCSAADLGITQTKLDQYKAKLQDIIIHHINHGGVWVTSTKFRPYYFFWANSSSPGTLSGNFQGASWGQLKGIDNVIDAVEKYICEAYPYANFGVDYGALYPSTIKWIGFLIEFMRKGD